MTQITDSDREAVERIRELLGIDTDFDEYTFSIKRGSLRSVFKVLAAMAAEIERLNTLAKANNDLAKMQAEQIRQLRREKAEAVELLREAGATSVRLEYTPAWHARRRTFLGQQEQQT